MKLTATPVPRPDAGCIWTSFQSSGRRHLILTGGRGSGKSTRLEVLAARLSDRALPGVSTWAQPGQAVWLRDNLTGEQAAVGRFDPGLPGPENRMRPVEEAFRTLGTGALARAAAAAGEWASVDEVGYLETSCPAYCQALLALMERKRVLLAVRKQELPFLQELCRRPDVFCVDLDAPFGRLGCVVMASAWGGGSGAAELLAGLWAGRCSSMPWTHRRRFPPPGGGHAGPRRRSPLPGAGIETILHSQPYRSDTVRLGLEALAGPEAPSLAGCLFCPADQPLLRRETVASLALCAACAPGPVWRPAWQGRPGAPVLFPRGPLRSWPPCPRAGEAAKWSGVTRSGSAASRWRTPPSCWTSTAGRIWNGWNDWNGWNTGTMPAFCKGCAFRRPGMWDTSHKYDLFCPCFLSVFR